MYGFFVAVVIIFSSSILAFKFWNFISLCRLTLSCQEERSGFSAELNSFYFIVCYETAADTRKMPSHHWAWGVQKRQEKKKMTVALCLPWHSPPFSPFSLPWRAGEQYSAIKDSIKLKKRANGGCLFSKLKKFVWGGGDTGSGIDRGGWRDEVRAVCWIYC